MPVPFIDLSRLTRLVAEDALHDFRAVLDRNEFVGGARVGALEKRLSEVLGVRSTVACANGTDALIIGLQTLGVRPGTKVALPNLTFWATYEAVAALGATPVLVDIDETDLQMSFDAFASAHRAHKFEAAILVHLYGWASARLGDFREYCKTNGVQLLEDGAQCFGVRAHGEPVLAGAEVATLSFYPAKVVGGAMDGGAMTFRSPEREALARSLANHGRSQHYSYAHSGWNSRMGGLAAAYLLRVLDHLPAILESRRNAASFYRARIGSELPNVRVYGPPAGIEENGYLNVLTMPSHDGAALVEAMKAKGIGTARTYPETLDVQPPAKGAILAGDLSRSKQLCAHVLNLPLFHGITPAECAEAVDALATIAR